jgi:hypothetical protein
MPMSDILLSGVLTGMVSSLAIVKFLLHRLLQIILELFSKNKSVGTLNTEVQYMLEPMSTADSGSRDSIWDLTLLFLDKLSLTLCIFILTNTS